MTRACPTCQGAAVKAGNSAFPFCSSRCRAIDLGHWLDEDYRIPVQDEGDETQGRPFSLGATHGVPEPDEIVEVSTEDASFGPRLQSRLTR